MQELCQPLPLVEDLTIKNVFKKVQTIYIGNEIDTSTTDVLQNDVSKNNVFDSPKFLNVIFSLANEGKISALTKTKVSYSWKSGEMKEINC
jgi:hypothetical protein